MRLKPAALCVLFTVPAFMPAQEIASVNGNAGSSTAGTIAISIPAPSTLYEPLSPEQKAKRRALNLVEPVTLLTSSFSAGLGQLRDKPPQWGEGADGFARRFADAEGYIAVHNSIALGFDLAYHLDPRYRRMPDAGFVPRLRNAITQTFVANKDSGGRMINVSEIGGNFGAGLVSNAWEPNGYNSIGNGMARGALGLAYDTLRNVTREFLPDILHPGRRAYSGSGSDLEAAFNGR